MSKKKHPDEALLALYAEHGSIWKVANLLDMCGQSIHERLVKLNAINAMQVFSDDEKKVLLVEYEKAADAGKLSDLAAAMGRTKQFICRQAKLLGLTNQNRKRPYLMEISRAAFIGWHQINGHPRGMLGKKHSSEAKENMGTKQRARWEMMTDEERSQLVFKQLKKKHEKLGTLVPNNRGKATWKAGWRIIGGQKKYFRSRWEANYARYLEFLRIEDKIKSWEHEPKTFWFEEIKRGVRSYLPDFRVIDIEGNITFHEVKGWMDDRSKTTLARMAKFYPEVCVILVDAKEYKKIEIEMRFLLHDWEI